MGSVLENIVELLFIADDDEINITITAIKHLSKIDKEAVAVVAPGTTAHLLDLFLRLHD